MWSKIKLFLSYLFGWAVLRYDKNNGLFATQEWDVGKKQGGTL